MISIIATIDLNNGIGINNNLLCHLPKNVKYFNEITANSVVVMGRKTYDSLPKKYLSKKTKIVISKSVKKLRGCTVIPSIPLALEELKKYENVFVIGGGKIFEQLLPYAKVLYMTRIYHLFEADTFFPELYAKDWTLESSAGFKVDKKHNYPFSFEKYNRK